MILIRCQTHLIVLVINFKLLSCDYRQKIPATREAHQEEMHHQEEYARAVLQEKESVEKQIRDLNHILLFNSLSKKTYIRIIIKNRFRKPSDDLNLSLPVGGPNGDILDVGG